MKKLLFILFLSFLSINIVSARVVKGTVYAGDDNAPLISATVFVAPEDLRKAGSNLPSLGVITDLDGNFSISIPENVTRLQASFIGYAPTTIKLTGATHYKIILDPLTTQLGDVVVTGYQRIEKRKLTAAVSKINIGEENLGTIRNIDQALSGQIAGLAATPSSGAPGAPVKIRIRGTASLSGTQDPLWVLDGLPLEGTDIPKMEDLKDIDEVYQSSIAGLNPADIESVTVLKDAAATAIYGARAANGVIVITTKSGKKGKTRINFSTKLSYSPNIDISRLNLLSSNEKIDLELALLASDYTYRSEKGGVSRIINKYGLLDTFKAGGYNALTPNAQAEISALRDINTDWNKLLFRDAFAQEYNLSISGGNDKATYYTSVGYYKELGNVKAVSTDRFNVLSKATYQVNKMLKLGASIFLNQRNNSSYLTDNKGFTNPAYYSRRANPYATITDQYNNYVYDMDIQGFGDESYQFNILEEQRNTTNTNRIQSISSVFDAELKINDNLRLTTQLGLQNDITSIDKIADNDSYAMRKDKGRASYKIGNEIYSDLPYGGMRKQNENKSFQYTWKAMAEYRKQFAQIHELEIMAGTEIRHTEYSTLYTAGYGYNRTTMATVPVVFKDADKAKLFPMYQASFTENAYVSVFSTLSYTLKQRYTLGGSIRFDGSDLFGVDKRYRYLPLYSVSGVWRLKGEEWLQSVDWLDNLAIRASYGLQGNIDKNTSPYLLGTYINNTTPILPLPNGESDTQIDISSAPNSKLRWEKTQSVNAGIDFSLFNQAIIISADYYNRLSTDLIGIQMLPLETGFMSATINWASMINEGYELSLTTRNISTKNFTWNTNFNIGFNHNKVLRVNVPDNQLTPSIEGYPVGAIFAYETAGLDENGLPLFRNKQGKIVSTKEFFKLGASGHSELSYAEQRDLFTYMGSSDPLYSGGMTNTFSYRRWELGINLIFNLGQTINASPSYDIGKYNRAYNTNRDILDRWTPTNRGAKLPALVAESNFKTEYLAFNEVGYDRHMDTWIRKGDYMRVQSIRLGYRIPENFLKKISMSSANISIEARNLFVIATDYKNYLDPETMGNEFAQPLPRTITVSLNLNF